MRVDIQKEELIDLLCVQRLTLEQAAARLGVHKKTVWNYKKAYAIDSRLWWKYQRLFCQECGEEIDPEVKFEEGKRKRLLKKGKVLCDPCKKEDTKKKDRERKRIYRENNRDEYNKYMRELQRKKAKGE